MNFVAIDFETANESMDSAISVGVVKFENGVKTDSFYSLIKPEPNLTPEYFLPRFIDIHGLTYDDIKGAKSFYEVWKSGLENFLDGKLPLVAHNGTAFDMKILDVLFKKNSLWYGPLKYFDSLWIARKTWTGLQTHRLQVLAKEFGIEYDAHNALADAETCGKIILLAAKEKGCSSVDELMKACGQWMKTIEPLKSFTLEETNAYFNKHE